MKWKFSRVAGVAPNSAQTRRAGQSVGVRAHEPNRSPRFYSLLLPPTSNSTRR